MSKTMITSYEHPASVVLYHYISVKNKINSNTIVFNKIQIGMTIEINVLVNLVTYRTFSLFTQWKLT